MPVQTDYLLVKLLRPEAIAPSYDHPSDTAISLHAATAATIQPGQTVTIPTGLAINVPVGHELQIRSRFNLATKNNVVVANSPGHIPSGYQGEISVALTNHGRRPFVVLAKSRIALAVVCPVAKPAYVVVEGSGG